MLTIQDKQKTLDHRKRDLRKRATPSELRIKALLTEMKIRFMFQKGFIKGHLYCIVDFYIPRLGLCLEIDGEYHNRPEQIRKDAYRDKYLVEYRKLRVLRLSNEIADMIDIQSLKAKLNANSVTRNPQALIP